MTAWLTVGGPGSDGVPCRVCGEAMTRGAVTDCNFMPKGAPSKGQGIYFDPMGRAHIHGLTIVASPSELTVRAALGRLWKRRRSLRWEIDRRVRQLRVALFLIEMKGRR